MQKLNPGLRVLNDTEASTIKEGLTHVKLHNK